MPVSEADLNAWLASERAAQNATMPSIYRDNNWVNRKLNQLQDKHRHMAVYWPTGQILKEGSSRAGSTALNAYDLSYIKLMKKDPCLNLIVIPELVNGDHWQPCVFIRDEKNGKWLNSVSITTRTNGTCGDSLVEEVDTLCSLYPHRVNI